MKTHPRNLPVIVCILPWLLDCGLGSATRAESLGTSFTYQGHLEEVGVPADGFFDLQFALFDAELDGLQVGSTVDSDDMLISNGLFTVELDFGSGVFSGATLWLEVRVKRSDSADELTVLEPRQQVTPTPYSLFAATAGNVDGHSLDAVDGDPSDAVFVDATGDVGVGTTEPEVALDVRGDLRASGTIASGGSLVLDGISDRITAASGTIDLDDENLTTAGTICDSTGCIGDLSSLAERLEFVPSSGSEEALLGGDKTGDRRGSGAIDIQASRSGADRVVTGSRSIALGSELRASGDRNLLIGGDNTNFSGDDNIALGYNLDGIGGGSQSIVIGHDTSTGGGVLNGRIMIGHSTVGLGQFLVVIGSGARQIGGSGGVVVGGGATVDSSENGIALGTFSHAVGTGSIALGGSSNLSRGARARQPGAIAIGSPHDSDGTPFNFGALADSARGIAIGTRTAVPVDSDDAIAIGSNARSEATAAVALGTFVTSSSAHTTAIGRFPETSGDATQWVATDPLFAIGDGADDMNRSNAFTVLKNGDVTVEGDLTVLGSCSGCSSDRTLKRDIRPLTDVLARIRRIEGVSFDWIEGVREAEQDSGRQIGVLAQDVESVFPELVETDSRGYRFVHYQKLVVPLIEALKEQQAQIDQLAAIVCLDHPEAEMCRGFPEGR